MTQTSELEFLEALTLEIVAKKGRDTSCSQTCRMIGKQCPPLWCEAIYQSVRKTTTTKPEIRTSVPLGIPHDYEMPPGLSPAGRELFRALKSLNRHANPDQMMRDLAEGKMTDG